MDEEREAADVADVRLDGPLDLRSLLLPPGLVRHTVTIESGGFLCAEGRARAARSSRSTTGRSTSCSPRVSQRLHAGALLFVAGIRDVELRCVGSTPAVLDGDQRT